MLAPNEMLQRLLSRDGLNSPTASSRHFPASLLCWSSVTFAFPPVRVREFSGRFGLPAIRLRAPNPAATRSRFLQLTLARARPPTSRACRCLRQLLLHLHSGPLSAAAASNSDPFGVAPGTNLISPGPPAPLPVTTLLPLPGQVSQSRIPPLISRFLAHSLPSSVSPSLSACNTQLFTILPLIMTRHFGRFFYG